MTIERIVDIAGEGRHLSLTRGFLAVSHDREELGRVPLDDIAAVIVHGFGTTLSANLLAALAQRHIFVVLCDQSHNPIACVWPLSGHHAQGARMRGQIAAGLPLKKRLWQQIVQAKIAAQAAVLDVAGGSVQPLLRMRQKVRSGDPDNLEAQAARHYWPRLMGSDFRRDRGQGGANAMLNYGYAVLRAATARAIVSSGLHPTIAVHHSAGHNDMALADDLMEPFRPLVDMAVRNLVAAGAGEVNAKTKAMLAGLLDTDMEGGQGTTTVGVSIKRAAHSLAQCFAQGTAALDLPALPPPVQLASLGRA